MRPAVAIMLLGLAGCASWQVIDEGTRTFRNSQFSVDLPVGWVRPLFIKDQVALTRDGFSLEQIVIMKKKNEQAFKKIKKSAEPSMLPSELAELQLAEFKAGDEAMTGTVKVIENTPANIAGRPGFRLHTQFKSLQGLPVEQIIYGVRDQDTYYMLGYEAPSLFYFANHRAEFEQLVASFRLVGKQAPQK